MRYKRKTASGVKTEAAYKTTSETNLKPNHLFMQGGE